MTLLVVRNVDNWEFLIVRMFVGIVTDACRR